MYFVNVQSRHHYRGFTLVELLVVIGIISILVAMLLPALNKARQAALRVSCASRMRQLSMMFQMYATESKGLFPALIKYDASGSWVYTNQVNYSYGRARGPGTSQDGLGLPGKGYIGYESAYPPDLANSLYRCPAQSNNKTDEKYWEYGYAYNRYIGQNGKSINVVNYGGQLRKSNHRRPSETMLLIERGSGADNTFQSYYAQAPHSHDLTDTTQYPAYLLAAIRHGGSGKGNNPGGINIAYVDGHVAWWNNINTLPTSNYNVLWAYDLNDVRN